MNVSFHQVTFLILWQSCLWNVLFSIGDEIIFFTNGDDTYNQYLMIANYTTNTTFGLQACSDAKIELLLELQETVNVEITIDEKNTGR